jgi:hypothetical protein
VTVGRALYSLSLLRRNLCSLGGRLLGTKVTGPEVLRLTPGMQRKRSQTGADDRDAKTDAPCPRSGGRICGGLGGTGYTTI